MISQRYPEAHILKDFKATGVNNILQSVGDHEILFVKAKSQDQLQTLIKNYLPSSFEGLIVSPFECEGLNSLNMSAEEMDTELLSLIEEFYPLDKVLPKIFGVTGTNGKTSVCWFFSELMKSVNKKVLYLGTIGTYLGGVLKEDKIITTTPSYLELRKIYHKYQNEVDYIALEVSSHALEQKRLGDITLNLGAWTNFTQDHLDFHKTMENYFQAKLKIKDITKNSVFALAEEDKILSALGEKGRSVSLIENIEGALGKGFVLKNLSLSVAVAQFIENEVKNIESVTLPPGRFEVIEHKERFFVIDYAHTPDALEKLLDQVKETYPTQTIYYLFGCGGDRDNSKRAKMGSVADKSGVEIIVTSDNPRTEDPEIIIGHIKEGISKDVLAIENREEAIKVAFEKSAPKDVIVIAGKGHESYQEINNKRYDYSDQKVVRGL